MAAPDSDDLADRSELQYEVAFRIALVSRRFRARFAERVKSSTHTEARWSALYQLSREPRGLIQSELAERMGIQGPTLVRLIDALEAQDLVRRISAPEDRRAKRVVIQPTGLEMVNEVDLVAAKLRDDAFASVTKDELIVTLKVLETLGVTLTPDATATPHGESSKARSPRTMAPE